MKYKDAISQALVDAMERDPKVVLLGQNVTAPHGVFGTTTEAFKRFPDRVLEIPVSETMITGACVGLAMEGYKPILVHCRADFSLLSFEHLINTAAKIPFLHGKPLPFVMRVVVGRGWGQGPVHSQSFHHLLAQVPGLNVIVAASPGRYRHHIQTALLSAIPTIIFEPRRLYEREEVMDSATVWAAPDITLIAIGDSVLDAVDAQRQLVHASIKANVRLLEYIGLGSVLPEPSMLLDIAPRRPDPGVLAPPFIPQGVSQVFQRVWYPTANDIVEAACTMLGKESLPRKETDGVYAPVGSAF